MNLPFLNASVESPINHDVIAAIFHVSEVTQHLLDAMRGAETVMTTENYIRLAEFCLKRLQTQCLPEDCICNDCIEEEERQGRR